MQSTVSLQHWSLIILTFRNAHLCLFVSHAHHDHYSPSVLRWKEQKQNIVYLFSSDAAKRSKDSTVHSLSAGDSFADGVLNVRAFGSTDVGVSFAVELDGMRLFHAGDLNNWHWEGESTTEEISDMATRFHRILSDIAGVYPSFDVAFFPVDPRMQGDYALGAREFLQKISCVNFIPMHFWGNFDAAQSFAPTATALGACFLCPSRCGDVFTI